jgi:hypothetical protein
MLKGHGPSKHRPSIVIHFLKRKQNECAKPETNLKVIQSCQTYNKICSISEMVKGKDRYRLIQIPSHSSRSGRYWYETRRESKIKVTRHQALHGHRCRELCTVYRKKIPPHCWTSHPRRIRFRHDLLAGMVVQHHNLEYI